MDSEHETTEEGASELMETSSAGVGDRLRSAREARRMDLAHVAAETRIPIRHLETIEAGDFAELPSRTYAIGFARSYARMVGLEEAAIADAVREELADHHGRASALAGGMEPGDPAKLPSAGLARFGVVAALILAVGLIAYFSSYFGAGDALPAIMAEEEAAPATAETDLAATEQDEAAIAPTADGQVVFTALEDGVWVRFYEDGGDRLFEATMESGDRFELPGDATEPRINTGRPDAFAITIGGREVPKLADEPVTMGDTPISAAALLARVAPVEAPIVNN